MRDKLTVSEAVEVLKDGTLYDKRFKAALDVAVEALENVQPERAIGEWVFWADDPDSNTYACSICKEPYMLIEGTPEDNKYNFCPNCGAKMIDRHGEESEG